MYGWTVLEIYVRLAYFPYPRYQAALCGLMIVFGINNFPNPLPVVTHGSRLHKQVKYNLNLGKYIETGNVNSTVLCRLQLPLLAIPSKLFRIVC